MSEDKKLEYINKRELILDTLKLLFDDWDMAEPLYNLVKSSEVTQNIIDTLVKILDMSFKDAKSDLAREKISGAMNNLKSLMETETKETEEDKIASQSIIDNLY